MSFDGMEDVERMFADAAGAAEETNEGDPSLVSKNPKANEPKPDPKPVMKEKEVVVSKPEPKPEPKEKQEREVRKRAPLINHNSTRGKSTITNVNSINVDVIDKIIQMKEIISEYDETQRSFVMGYFQVEDDSAANAIYSSLTASSRDLKALEMIVTARGNSPADRAFYLMALDNGDIEAIYEQVELLAGEINSGIGRRVTHDNKIEVCKLLERTIAEMESRVFDYINKLQAFTNLVK